DGFAVAGNLRERPDYAAATILLLSSAGPLRNAARCRELGVAAYLTKPVKHSELRHALLATLGSLDAEGQRPAGTSGVGLPSGRRLRILLAEDNPVNQMLAVFLLEKRGHRVVPAANGRDALRLWETQPF